MIRRRYGFHIGMLVAVLLGLSTAGFGQIYSYVDENGVRVFTNTPTAPTQGLQLRSAPPPKPAAAQGPAKSSRTANQKPGAKGTAAGKPADRSATEDPAAQADGDSTGPGAGYAEIIEKYAAEFGVDAALIHAMIQTESGFNPAAVSPKGAQGLMQLMPATASRLEVSDPFDPKENIRGGVKYMRSLLERFSDRPDSLLLSLAAYNAGENLVERLGRVPAIRETNEYVRTITQRYGKRETELREPASANSEPVPIRMPTFRYYDETGVLVLTNIPPVAGISGKGGIFR